MKLFFDYSKLILAVLSITLSFTLKAQFEDETSLPSTPLVSSFPYAEFGVNTQNGKIYFGMIETNGDPAYVSKSFYNNIGIWYRVKTTQSGSIIAFFQYAETSISNNVPHLALFKQLKSSPNNTSDLERIDVIENLDRGSGDPDALVIVGSSYTWIDKYPSLKSRRNFVGEGIEDFSAVLDTDYTGSWTSEAEILDPGTYWLHVSTARETRTPSNDPEKETIPSDFIIDFVPYFPPGSVYSKQSVAVCEDTYTAPNGDILTESGSYSYILEGAAAGGADSFIDLSLTFERAEVTTDIFQDALIAESGSITYEANTNATGILTFNKAEDRWVDLNALQDDLSGKSRFVFMWIKSESNVVGDNQVLFGMNAATGTGNVSIFLIDNDGENLELFDGSDSQSSSFDMGDQQWHYVGYTYDNTTTETVTYVDGIENDRFNDSQTGLSDTRYSLGQEFDGTTTESDHFNGDMAEVSVWDEVLTGPEVRTSMESKITASHPKYTNLVGYYSIFGACDEDTSVLKDHSGKGNDGVLENITIDFANAQSINGFNAIAWYDNLSWKKEGTEVSTASTYTTEVGAGNYEFVATRNFIQSTDTWTMTLNTNAATVDNLADETLCTDAAINRTISTSEVNYLEFEETESNYVAVNTVSNDLVAKDRSIFMWINKESNIGSGDVNTLFAIQGSDVGEEESRFYIRSTEKLAVWNGDDRLEASTTLDNETWYHVGYTYDAATFETKIYVNGTLEATGTTEMPVSQGSFTSIAQNYVDNGPSGFFDGKLAEVTVWDKVLTEEEVAGITAAAPAHNAANLVAAYGTLNAAVDNRLYDLTSNNNDGLVSHSTIIVKTEEATIAGYNANNNYSFSWEKAGTEFHTDVTVSIVPDEGTTNYSVTYGTPLFQKTEEFALSYTNLIPTQPVSKTAGATGSTTFEVDNIAGASYQWYDKAFGTTYVTPSENGSSSASLLFDLTYSNGVMYLGTNEGLSISKDDGLSWTNVTNATEGYAEFSSSVSVVAVGPNVFVSNPNSGISISNNSGDTWRNLYNNNSGGFGAKTIRDIFLEENNVYAVGGSSSSNLYISNDLGQNWNTISLPKSSEADLNSSPDKVFVVNDLILISMGNVFSSILKKGGLLFSLDGGTNWTRKAPGVDGFPEGAAKANAVFAQNGVWYLGTVDNGLYISKDQGNTWVAGTQFEGYSGSNAVYDFELVGNRLYVANGKIQYTDDDGLTWSDLYPESELTIKNLIFGDGGNWFIEEPSSSERIGYAQNKNQLSDNSDITVSDQIQGATTHQLTINNLSLDTNASEYYVTVAKDGCEQTSDEIGLSVLDVPIVSSFSPAKSSSDIAIDALLSMAFNKDITAGTGNLKIFTYDTDAEVQSFTASELAISGSTVSIPTGVSLANATQYYITLDAGIVKEASNAGNLARTDKDFWTFTTICETLVTAQPTDQNGIIAGSATFSVPEVSGASYKWFKVGSDSYTILQSLGDNQIDASNDLRSIFVQGDNIYAITKNVLSISRDGGETWTLTAAGQNDFTEINYFSQIAGSTELITLVTSIGLSISTDEGQTWVNWTLGDLGDAKISGFIPVSIKSIHAHGSDIYLVIEDIYQIRHIYSSSDLGQTWTRMILDYNSSRKAIFVDGNNIYSSTLNSLDFSSDGGETWNSFNAENEGFGSSQVHDVWAAGNNIYAATAAGVSISINAGLTWTTTTANQNGFPPVDDVSAVFVEGEAIYLTAGDYLSMSEDGGQTWDSQSSVDIGFPTLSEISSLFVEEGVVYVANAVQGLGFKKSSEKLVNSPDLTLENVSSGADTRELTLNNLTLDLDQTEYYVEVTKVDCEETSDVATLTVTFELLVVTQPTDQSGPVGGSATFSVPEVTGANYQWFQNQEGIDVIRDLSADISGIRSASKRNNVYYIGSSAGFFIVDDAGVTNLPLASFVDNITSQFAISAVTTNSAGVYFTASNYGLFSSLDNGLNWSFTNRMSNSTGLPRTKVYENIRTIEDELYLVVDNQIYKSTDNAASWNLFSSFPTTAANQDIRSYDVENNTIAIINTDTDALVSISTDGSATWTTTSASSISGLSNDYVNFIRIDGEDIYLGTGKGFFKSSDSGSTWSDMSIEGIDYLDFFVEGSLLLVKNRGSLYSSVNEGATWEVVGRKGGFSSNQGSSGYLFVENKEITFIDRNKQIIAPKPGIELQTSDKFLGTDTNAMTIDNLTLSEDESRYFVKVSKQGRTEVSNYATLFVTNAPVITALSPADDAEQVALDATISITFDRDIAKGTGNIEVRRASDDQVLTTISANSTLVTVNDKTATLRLGDINFDFATEYYITIENTAFENTGGDAFAGILDKTTWSFTTAAQAQALEMVSFTPVNGAVDVPIDQISFTVPQADWGGLTAEDTKQFTIEFKEEVSRTNVDPSTVHIKLYKAEGDELISDQDLIAIIDGPNFESAEPTKIIFRFKDVVFEGLTEYYILMDEGIYTGKQSGVTSKGITDKTTWSFTTEAEPIATPEITSLFPIAGATDVAVDFNQDNFDNSFAITLDQDIVLNEAGNFRLFKMTGDEFTGLTRASTLQLSEDKRTLKMFFVGEGLVALQADTEYYILTSNTSPINNFSITDKTTWSFTTETVTNSPQIASLSPADDSENLVAENLNTTFPNFNKFWVTLNEGVKFGNTASEYRLYTADDDVLVASQSLLSTLSGPQTNNKVYGFGFYSYTFEADRAYYIQIDAGIFKSTTTDEDFAGITDKTTWSFTTEAVTAEPLEISTNSPNSTSDAQLDFPFINLTFEESTAAGTGAITIYRTTDNSVFEAIDVSEFIISNGGRPKRVQIRLSQGWEAGVLYYVQFPEGLITSLDGSKRIEAITDNTTFAFKTEDFSENIITGFFPANGSTTYVADSGDDLKLFTSLDLGLERDPLGSFRIYKGATNELVKTIEYDGENDRDLNYGNDEPEIAFEFDSDELEPATEYYVLIDDGFVVSYEDELFHLGISDPNTWRFTTLALPSAPVVESTLPNNNAADVSTTTEIVLNFSENMVAGTGNVDVYLANGTLLETIEASATTVSGAKVTAVLANALSNNETYYLLIGNDAFESTNGVAFAGISDDQVFRFTTEAAANTLPTASNQTFTGTLEANQILSGTYTYTDADSDAESGTTFQWYAADDATGANSAPINSATAASFTLTSTETGKFIAFGITPNDGKDAGVEVLTTYQGPMLSAVIPTLVSTVPVDGAFDIAKDIDLSFVLSESVTKGTGNIVLTPVSGGATQIDVTSSEVTVSGTEVSINPTTELLEGQFYTITFDATAFVDADGNNAAGLTSQTIWNFTTKEANVAPVAKGVTLNKSLVVDGVLEGSYSYSDSNGDTESGTTFKWYRADDINGTGKAEIAAVTAQTYTVVSGDDGKFISFEVTPNDGTLAGAATESVFFGPIIINNGTNNIPPAFTSDALTSIKDKETYTYTVTYEDLNDDVPVLTKTNGPAWLSVSDLVLSGSPTVSDVGEHDVVLTLDDQNGGTATQAFKVTVLLSNTAPSVNGVDITGTTTIGEELTGSYNFIDAEKDSDNATYQWYSADDNSGTGKTAISDATLINYTLTATDAGKYISFEVLPNDGKVNGDVGSSVYSTEVLKKVPTLNLAAITKTYGDEDFDLTASTNSPGTITYAFDNDQTNANVNGATVRLGNVGTINVDISLAEDGEYQARQVASTITVTKRAIEFTATSSSKAYGALDPNFFGFTVTSGSLVSDAEVVRLSRDQGEAVGTYAITFSDGEGAGNFEISTINGLFTIEKAPITVTATAATKVYGAADPEFAYTISTGALLNADVLSGAVTRATGENVGTYALASSLFNGNYTITFEPADLSITPKALTITADNKTRDYGQANPSLTATYTGLVNGDNKADIDVHPTLSTEAVLSSAAGSYPIIVSGATDANYSINPVNGSLEINDVTISLSIADVTVTEGDTEVTVSVTLSNEVSGGFTVDISSVDVSATASSDYQGVTSQRLTFVGTKDEVQSLTFSTIEDVEVEQEETFTFELSALGNTSIVVDITDKATVTIQDNDVAKENIAPVVASAITDITEDEGFSSNTVDLSSVFTDADGDDLIISATSSSEVIATVSIMGTTLTYTEVGVGSTTITVTADDGNGGTVTDDFTITINAVAVNTAPVVASAITDITEDEGFSTNTVDLSSVFTDADGDDLTISATSSSEVIATVSIMGTTLTYTEVGVGSTTITVTADDGNGGTVTDEFTITINAVAVNTAPVVANAITDITEEEGFSSNTVDLSSVFTDADGDDLTISATSSSEVIATVSIAGSTLTYTEVSVGSTTITVTADDGNGGTIADDFTITINAVAVNTAPTVTNAIIDITEDEGFSSNTVDLSSVFTDADGDDLTISATSSSEVIATVSIAGSTLTYTEVSVGSTTITVTADDSNGGTIADDFTITINAVTKENTAPVVASAITDITEDEGFSTNTVDLSSVFTDADGDDLTFSATSSSEVIATVSIMGATLTYTAVGVGSTTITVTADDGNGGTVTDHFTITINAVAVNTAPVVASAITDITEDEGFASKTVDLSSVFTDADGDDLTISATSSSEVIATVSIMGTTLTYTAVGVGSTTITVTADDGNDGTVTDEFTITINAVAVNTTPVVANAITDITEEEGFSSNTVDLSSVFTDADGDLLTFTALSSDRTIADVNVSGTALQYFEEANGVATITVTANDGRGGIITDEFTLTIVAPTVPPEAAIPQGFSPNGDGVNDMWQVPNIENFPNNTVTIFDRQGNKVYQADGYNNTDVAFIGLASAGAINKSQGLADGVYYYVITLGNGELRKGHIIIKQ